MKRFYFILLTLIYVLSVSAQLEGSGYYRVKNYGSQRYIYVCDGTSSGINMSTTSVDMGAVQTWSDLNKAITDPASVIYIQSAGDMWDLMAQGTSVHSLIGYYVDIIEKSHDSNIYQVAATVSGQTLYLYDGETSTSPRGRLVTGKANGSLPQTYNRWQIFALNQTDNYVAVAPELSNGGKYYAPYYVSFPFSYQSSGMKTYYIKKVDAQKKLAVITELTGVVPSSTPVIIECSTNTVENNKLKLEYYGGYTDRPTDNVLDGVYFSNPYRESDVSYRKYDSNTMRILGTTSEGKLGFVTATNDMLHKCGDSDSPVWCLWANQSYLPVEAGSPAEFTIVTEAEYEALSDVKVSSVTLDKTTVTSHVGETVQLTATVLPDNATNKALVWKSSDETVAIVSNGLVSMKSLGTATITATTTDGSDISATCSVTCEPILVSQITLDKTELSLDKDATAQLIATVLPENATNKQIEWSSSNESVATVSSTGLVTAVEGGNASVMAIATDGSEVSASCAVVVVSIDGISTVDINDCPEGCKFYTVSGQSLPTPRRGLMIVKYSDGKYAKVIVK